MRSLVLLCVLAGCDWTDHPAQPHRIPDPDAYVSTNCLADFSVLAPQPDLHYAPDLIAIADVAPFYADGYLNAVADDDLGGFATPIGPPTRRDLVNGDVELTWSFTLLAGRRYVLYLSATECEQSVEFFTSP